MSTTPTIGRIVHYVLSKEDAAQINRRRTDGASIAERLTRARWHEGAQAHIGNSAFVGMILPAIVVSSFGDSEDLPINLQVFLDGNDTFWATSRHLRIGEQNGGYWQWPPQAPVPAPIKAEAPVEVPKQPPVDNAPVAEGCEQFTERKPEATVHVPEEAPAEPSPAPPGAQGEGEAAMGKPATETLPPVEGDQDEQSNPS